MSTLSKTILIIIYICIILLIPFFLDYLFKITVRKKRLTQIMQLAIERSKKTNKSIILFNNKNNGKVIDQSGKEEVFTGKINELIGQFSNNSCIIIVVNVLEYLNPGSLNKTIKQLKRVSGGDLYLVNIEKNSPKVFWDYKLKNIMDKSYYLPQESITWTTPNELQKKTLKIYSYIFKVVPYKSIKPYL